MASSKASTSRNITFTRKNGNFMSFLSCDQGDIYVDFKDENSINDNNYAPLFSPTNFRILELNIINSMNIPFTVRNVDWEINGDNLSDPTKGLTLFYEKDGNTGLKIKGSIAAKSGNMSITIVATATLDYGSESTIVRASYHIPVRQTSGDVWHVTIASCDNNDNYTIRSGNDSIDVQCLVYDPTGTAQDASKFRYDWYKWVGINWVAVETGKSGNRLTIPQDLVDNQAMFKVEVFAQKEGGGYEDEPLGMDTQMIYDSQDTYFIEVMPSRDESIEQDSGTQVDYRIVIQNASLGSYARKARVSFYLHAYGAVPANYKENLEWDCSHTGDASGDPLTYGPDIPMFSVYERNFTENGCSVLTLDIAAEIYEG